MFKKTLYLFALSIIFILPGKLKAADNEMKHMPEAAKSCFVTQWGEAALNEIMSGERVPTDEEKAKGASCFQNMFKENKKIVVKGDVKACIKKNLGKDLDEIGELSDADRAKIESCFASAKVGVAFPNETKRCIISVVGESRAKAIMESGEPTNEEKMAIGPKCFGAKPPKDANMENVPAEAKACIQNIIGKKIGPPTEAQRKQIDEKCFGGAERETAKQKMNGLSETEKACLENLFHKSMEAMGKLTADQERQAGATCFQKTSTEQLTREEPQRRNSGLTTEQKACMSRILGADVDSIGELNSSQQQQVGECFATNTATSSSAGNNTGGSNPNTGSNPMPDTMSSLKDVTKQCIAERLGLTVATLGNADFNDPNVNLIVGTCKTNNGEE